LKRETGSPARDRAAVRTSEARRREGSRDMVRGVGFARDLVSRKFRRRQARLPARCRVRGLRPSAPRYDRNRHDAVRMRVSCGSRSCRSTASSRNDAVRMRVSCGAAPRPALLKK
jgi:hypothetical protein